MRGRYEKLMLNISAAFADILNCCGPGVQADYRFQAVKVNSGIWKNKLKRSGGGRLFRKVLDKVRTTFGQLTLAKMKSS